MSMSLDNEIRAARRASNPVYGQNWEALQRYAELLCRRDGCKASTYLGGKKKNVCACCYKEIE